MALAAPASACWCRPRGIRRRQWAGNVGQLTCVWSAIRRRAYYSLTAGTLLAAPIGNGRRPFVPIGCVPFEQGEHNLAKPNFGYQKRQKELEKKRKKEEKMKRKLEKNAPPTEEAAAPAPEGTEPAV